MPKQKRPSSTIIGTVIDAGAGRCLRFDDGLAEEKYRIGIRACGIGTHSGIRVQTFSAANEQHLLFGRYFANIFDVFLQVIHTENKRNVINRKKGRTEEGGKQNAGAQYLFVCFILNQRRSTVFFFKTIARRFNTYVSRCRSKQFD